MSDIPTKKIATFSSVQLIVLTSLFITTLANFSFYSEVLKVYPPTAENIIFLGSLFIGFNIVTIWVLSALCHRVLVKPVLIFFLLASSSLAYFADQYGIIFDRSMVGNAIGTDFREARDLVSPRLFLYVFFLGIMPSVFIYYARLKFPGYLKETTSRLKLVFASIAIAMAMMWPLSDFYASFLREHKRITYYANPTYAIYSAGSYASRSYMRRTLPFAVIGADAAVPESDVHRELVIMVVGETARADHFSLNGYARETNPLLKQAGIVNFSNVWSCGTSTAVSVPCMFSSDSRVNFSTKTTNAKSNVLDILSAAGVHVLWRDNNSSSKGVADRLLYEDFKTSDNNRICDVECRDEGMLQNLEAFIDKRSTGDIMIVLHQMGNHGPAYYKRYPKEFEYFKPACQTNNLNDCTTDEVTNAYDNAIRYTDYFLAKVIEFLKTYDQRFETAMVYISDHGESLGENGVYLHGFPYWLAPDAQKHVPMVMWFGKNFDREALVKFPDILTQRLSHDNLFPTLLSMFEVESELYDPKLDILDRSYDEHQNAKSF